MFRRRRRVHHEKHRRGAERVDTEDRRCDKGNTCRSPLHCRHPLFCRDRADAPLDDRRGLRRPPRSERRHCNGEKRGRRAGQRPPERHSCCRRSKERRGNDDGAGYSEVRRPQMHTEANERFARGVFFDQRAHVEPRPSGPRGRSRRGRAPSRRSISMTRTARYSRGQAVNSERTRLFVVHFSLQ